MTNEDEARYLARTANLVDAFRQIAKEEHAHVVAEAALAFLAEILANQSNREELVQHVRDHLAAIVDQIAAGGKPDGDQQGSA